MFFDKRLMDVAGVLRPEALLPVILGVEDTVGPTRVRELQDNGVNVHYASRLTPQLAGRVAQADLASLQKSGVVMEAWYDAPHYASVHRIALPTTGIVRKSLADVREFTGSKDVHDAGARGKGVLVAVCDTGIDDSHQMLYGQVKQHLTFTGETPDALDQVGHGTWTASAVAGRPVEYQGRIKEHRGRILQGMAPDAQLLDCRVLDKDGKGLSSQIIAGIEAAVMNGARVVNVSLGSLFGGAGRTPDAKVVDEAAKRGVNVVVAAGNSFGYVTVGSPGSAAGAITVGAVAMEMPSPGVGSTFSSRGPTIDGRLKPDLAAPGGNWVPRVGAEPILGATSGALAREALEPYAGLMGTSMATPCLAGIIAQAVPLGFPTDRSKVEGVLALSSQGVRVKNNRVGWGVVDARRLVAALQNPPGLPVRGWVGVQTFRARPALGAAAGLAARVQSLPAQSYAVRLP